MIMTTLTPPKPSTPQLTLWLEPDCYECDRREWQSLWSMEELQDGHWHYIVTEHKPDGWHHRFHRQAQQLSIKAYHVWVMQRFQSPG